MKNDQRISRALRDMAGGQTCANCLARSARVDPADVTTFLAGMHDRQRIEVEIARCTRCGQSARVFRLSKDPPRDNSKATA